jgi:hypothetical protein
MQSCSITVSFLFDHCFCQKVLCLRTHCCITVPSLSHHCLITVFVKGSFVTSRCIITLQMHCKRIKYDQWHLKTLQMILKSSNQRHHCCITVSSLSHHCLTSFWSLFWSKGLVSPNTLPRHCKTIKYDQWQFKSFIMTLKSSNQMHHCSVTVASLFHHCLITVTSLFLSKGNVSPPYQ